MAAIVYQGAEIIDFVVNLLPPLTQMYVFANNQDITFTCVPDSEIIGDNLITNEAGELVGKILLLSTGVYRFPAGEIDIVFCDNKNGPSYSTFTAQVKFFNGMVTRRLNEFGSVGDTGGSGVVSTVPNTNVPSNSLENYNVTASVDSLSTSSSSNQDIYPLSQTFLIDSSRHPLGIVITSLELCILEKDPIIPIGIEFRPMKNGVPDISQYITGTSVFKKPNEITLGSASNPITTKFIIKPTYFLPGEYSFSIITNSDKYKLASGKLGSKNSDGQIITNQPYIGKLFKIQTGGIWEPDLNEDIYFKLYKAKFNTGQASFELHSPKMLGVTTDSATFKTKDITVGETCTIDYRLKIKNIDGTYTSPVSIFPDKIHRFYKDFLIKDKSDCVIQVTFNNKSSDVSPILDVSQSRLLSNKHLVFAWEEDISDSELDSTYIGAKARYLSRVVTVLEGFDSTGLEVKLDVNRVSGSDIEVLCRVLSREDTGSNSNIEDQPFKRMTLISPPLKTFAGNDHNSFSTEIYKILEPDLSYKRIVKIADIPDVKEFLTFNQFQIKIVFYANFPGMAPKIKNLIATSVL
jgi:hypothetical protein